MYKKIIATSLVATALLFSGCGEDSTTCRIDVQTDLDQDRFDSAIERLNGECKDVFSPSDRNYNLASSYMGKSGFGISDVVKIVIDSANDNGDTFSSFIDSINKNKTQNSLIYLSKAKDYFLMSANPDLNETQITDALCNGELAKKDSRSENACLYVGFNQTLSTATAITYLSNDVDRVVSALDDNSQSNPDDMMASLDALSWATNNPLGNGSTINHKEVVIKGQTYTHLEVVLNGKTYYRLARYNVPSAYNTTLITDGYCDTDGQTDPCLSIEDSDGSINNTSIECYACPVIFDADGSSQDIAELLVSSLNSGTDGIANLTNDEELTNSVKEFRKDITGDENKEVTIDDILNYLNN